MKQLFFFALFSAQALVAFTQTLQPGIKIGGSVPDLRGTTAEGRAYSSRLAPFAGISVTTVVRPNFNLQLEINYSPQGGRRSGMQPVDTVFAGVTAPAGTSLNASYKDEIRINYLELPLLVQIFAEKPQQDDKKLFYFINLGPYIAYRLNAKHTTRGKSLLYTDEQGSRPLRTEDGMIYPAQSFNSKTDITDGVKRLTGGITGSIGTGYNYSGHKFFLEGRFTRGIAGIHVDRAQKSLKTASLVLAAGYIYSFE